MFEEIDKELYEGKGSGVGILQGLQDECQQWATRFPHLRYVIYRFLLPVWHFSAEWTRAAVGSKNKAEPGDKPEKKSNRVCHSGSWGVSWSVPVMRASSGTPPQGRAARAAAYQQAKRAVWSPWRKTRAAQSKSLLLRFIGWLTARSTTKVSVHMIDAFTLTLRYCSYSDS